MLRLISVFASAVLTVSAASPVATVTAPSQITISGASVPATAAASLPVGFGDQISTGNSSALLKFGQRGVVTLSRHSTVRIENHGDQTVIDLVEGSYHYKFTPGSMLTAHKNNAPVPSGLEGSVSTGHGLNVPVAFAPSGDSTILTSGVAAKKSRDCPPGHGDGHDCSVIK